MPAFESTSGEYISEGSAIALYIALSAPASGLVPSTPVGQAQVAQWQGFVDFAVLTNLCAPSSPRWSKLTHFHVFTQSRIFVYGSIAGFNHFSPELVKAKLAAAIDALAKLDAFLSLDSRKFLLGGENVTLADIAVVSGLVRGYQGVYDK